MTWLELAVRYGPPLGATLLLLGTVMRAPTWLPEPFSFRRVVRTNQKYSVRMRAEGDEASARRAEARLADHLERLQRYGRRASVVGIVVLTATLLLAVAKGSY
jgi:hypothetical protein